jgi:peptidoglycan/xylan/chitin deacetylase (PgdA/CDA1 family)
MENFKIPILMYHSIEKMPRSTRMRSLHVPPKRFNFQMMLLKILGYKGLSMRELTPYLLGKKKGKVIGITFDDGYQNVLLNAAPVLKKYKFTATCYIVSQRIGSSNIWDMENKITQRPLMDIKEIKEWISLGMDVGAHSQTHEDLTIISSDAAKKEIDNSKCDLEKLLNLPVVDFCYPYGHFDQKVSNLANEAGYLSATTMVRGRVSSDFDMFQLPRIPINHHTLPHLFLAKILTQYEDRK